MTSDPAPYPPERAAQYERLVEATAPPPENPCTCTCDRCHYPHHLWKRAS